MVIDAWEYSVAILYQLDNEGDYMLLLMRSWSTYTLAVLTDFVWSDDENML